MLAIDREDVVTGWRALAACRGLPLTMFSEPGGGSDQDRVELCAGCPVAWECLHLALDEEHTDGCWAGTSWEDRVKMCPVCHEPKEPEALGCTEAHSLLRLARLREQQEMGYLDVSVSLRQEPTARTSPYCPRPRGMNHSTSTSYRGEPSDRHKRDAALGCRCKPALKDHLTERAVRKGRR